jgi:hemerythrin-like domain-containing protein
MAVQIGARPDSGFDDPIGMLKDCHRRIEYFLKILCIVVERARARILTSEEAAAVESALHYFRVGGQRHNADEEESLFPRLRADLTFCSFEEIAGLESDHQAANALHKQVEQDYRAWIANKRLSTMREKQLLDATQRLHHLYDEHTSKWKRALSFHTRLKFSIHRLSPPWARNSSRAASSSPARVPTPQLPPPKTRASI